MAAKVLLAALAVLALAALASAQLPNTYYSGYITVDSQAVRPH